MAKPLKPIHSHEYDPCPCGSGKRIIDCHLDPITGGLRKRLPSLLPPRPSTGFSHPRCYLRGAADCSTKISGEHFLSEAILKEIGDPFVRVRGSYWLGDKPHADFPSSALNSKILCGRHNSCLSPLDAEAVIFFRALQAAIVDLSSKSLRTKATITLVSGEALELWGIKVAAGLHHGGGSADGIPLKSSREIDIEKVAQALFSRKVQPHAGLYFNSFVPDPSIARLADGVSVAPLTSQVSGRMSGAAVAFRGVRFEIVFDPEGMGEVTPQFTFRPSQLILHRGNRQHLILLSWPPGTLFRGIRIEVRRGTPP